MAEEKIEHEIKTIILSIGSTKLELNPKKGKELIENLLKKHKTYTECSHGNIGTYDFTVMPGMNGSHDHYLFWLCDDCAKEIIKMVSGAKEAKKNLGYVSPKDRR